MKKIMTLILIMAVMLFGGISNAIAATTSLPDYVISDKHEKPTLSGGLREVEYIKNFPVIVKTANNGKYYIYCMNLSATYAADVQFNKTGVVDPGFTYIVNNKPNTGDKDKDFYIVQMAVWYYEDYLNQNNFNLVSEVKKYIIAHKDTEEVSKKIYALYEGAKNYKEKIGELSIDKKKVTFTKEGEYFVSSEIKVVSKNLKGNVKYTLSKAPAGAMIVRGSKEDTVVVKVPVAKIDQGKQITLSMNVEGNYTKYTGYYYFHSSKYQRVLFQDALETNVVLKDSIEMTVGHLVDNFEVNISKTDITKTNEVEGATLVIKDSSNNIVDKWVSTKETHKVTLKVGEYTLTEILAPKGYKLSKTTVAFKLDLRGDLYVKNESGEWVLANKVIMVNELIDVVSFAKKDKKTNTYLKGAKLVIKDEKGNLVHQFTSTEEVYQVALDPGRYTLSEVSAPKGYLLSNEVVSFELIDDGTVRVKNEKGEYIDSAIITFYNTPETKEEVKVPATGKEATLLIMGGIALLIGGVACARKTIKEC